MIFAGQCKFERLCKVIRTFRSEWKEIEAIAKSSKKSALPRRLGSDELQKSHSRKRKLASDASSSSVSPHQRSPAPERTNPASGMPGHAVAQHPALSPQELAQALVSLQSLPHLHQYLPSSQQPAAANPPPATPEIDNALLYALLTLASVAQPQQAPAMPTLPIPGPHLPNLSEALAALTGGLSSGAGGEGGLFWQLPTGLAQARSTGGAPHGNGDTNDPLVSLFVRG